MLSVCKARSAQRYPSPLRKRKSQTARRRRRASFFAPKRAPSSAAECTEIRRPQPTLARSDRDPRTRRRPTRTDRAGACFPYAKRDRPSATRHPSANESLKPRAAGAARPSSRQSARQAAQPNARKYVDPNRPWHDQIAILERGADLRKLTGQAHAFPMQSAIGPAPPVTPPQTKVSNRAPQAPRVLIRAKARAKQRSRMHGNTSTPTDLGTIRSRSSNEAQTYEN